MNNVINSELYKVRNRKSIKVSLIIITIIGLIMGAAVVAFGENMGADIKGSEYIVGTAQISVSFLMIFAYIIPAMIVTSEFKDNTIKNPLFIGTSRTKLLLSKVLIMALVLVVLILAITIPPLIIVTVSNGWGEAFAFGTILSMLVMLFRVWLFLFAYCCIFVLIGVIIRNLIGSIALGYAWVIVEQILAMISQGVAKYEWIGKFLLVTKNNYIAVGIIEKKEFWSITGFCSLVCVISIGLALLHFNKQEIRS